TCPACGPTAPLIARLVGEVLLDECGTCRGLWVDAGAVDRIVRERSEKAVTPLREILSPREPTQPIPAQSPSKRKMYLACRDCSQIMNRVNFARRSGVILDVCRPHGTWFDADELPRVVEFVVNGGVEASQRADLAELRDQARREKVAAQIARS